MARRKISDDMEIKKNINVGVRVRPLTSLERERGEKVSWDIDTVNMKIRSAAYRNRSEYAEPHLIFPH